MNDEIKAILEKLKDNIPIEEYRSEGTSDGLTHYEEDKDSWQYKLLDYITNLRTIEQQYSAILSENAELENKLTNLQEENQRLKELCDKYEEEHNTAFKLWKMKMEEMPTYEEKETLKLKVEKAIKYIKHSQNYGKEKIIYINGDDLLNILNGGYEE